jgi:hypothetical protein
MVNVEFHPREGDRRPPTMGLINLFTFPIWESPGSIGGAHGVEVEMEGDGCIPALS